MTTWLLFEFIDMNQTFPFNKLQI